MSEHAPATEPSAERQPVLEFCGACLIEDTGLRMQPIDLALMPGSLTLIDTADAAHAASIADAAVGLRTPAAGQVLFLGGTSPKAICCAPRAFVLFLAGRS